MKSSLNLFQTPKQPATGVDEGGAQERSQEGCVCCHQGGQARDNRAHGARQEEGVRKDRGS